MMARAWLHFSTSTPACEHVYEFQNVVCVPHEMHHYPSEDAELVTAAAPQWGPVEPDVVGGRQPRREESCSEMVRAYRRYGGIEKLGNVYLNTKEGGVKAGVQVLPLAPYFDLVHSISLLI